jgi:hypothetical protein
VLRGGITTVGPLTPSGSVRLTNQRISVRSGPTCTGAICLSGGIRP